MFRDLRFPRNPRVNAIVQNDKNVFSLKIDRAADSALQAAPQLLLIDNCPMAVGPSERSAKVNVFRHENLSREN